MGEYVLCAIQLKQTYEADQKKAEKEGKSSNKCNRRAPSKQRRDKEVTSQGQEEIIKDSTYQLNGELMQMMLEKEEQEHANTSGFSQFDNGLVQEAHTEDPVICYNHQQPLYSADQLMMTTPACTRNLYCPQVENSNVAFGEGLDQSHTVNSDNINLDGRNMVDHGPYRTDNMLPVPNGNIEDNMFQVQAVQTKEPVVLWNQEQQPFFQADQLMITSGYTGNLPYPQVEDSNFAFGDGLDQLHTVYSDNNFLDENVVNYGHQYQTDNMLLDGRDQLYNQDYGGVLVGGLEDGIDDYDDDAWTSYTLPPK
uniref:Uncharacterized protein n=1 Tax=Leersia perrieri TaxID=77586 RepID=A0A0D9XWU9_9ORYZ